MDRDDCVCGRAGLSIGLRTWSPALQQDRQRGGARSGSGRRACRASSRIQRPCPRSSAGLETAIQSSGWRLMKSCANGLDKTLDMSPGQAPRSERVRSSGGKPGCETDSRVLPSRLHPSWRRTVNASARSGRSKRSGRAIRDSLEMSKSSLQEAGHVIRINPGTVSDAAWAHRLGGKVCLRLPGLRRRRGRFAAARGGLAHLAMAVTSP